MLLGNWAWKTAKGTITCLNINRDLDAQAFLFHFSVSGWNLVCQYFLKISFLWAEVVAVDAGITLKPHEALVLA